MIKSDSSSSKDWVSLSRFSPACVRVTDVSGGITSQTKAKWFDVWWTMLGPSFQFIGSSLSFLHLRLQEWVWLWPVIAALLVRGEGGCPWLGRKARKGKWLGLSELTLELGRCGLGVRERDHGSLSFLQRELTCDVHINVYAVLSLHERGCSQN